MLIAMIAVLSLLFWGAGWGHPEIQKICLFGLLLYVFLIMSCFSDLIYIGRRKN